MQARLLSIVPIVAAIRQPRMSSLSWQLLMAVIGAAAGVGCRDVPPTQVTPLSATTAARAVSGTYRGRSHVQTFDDEMMVLADSIPGFGGFHVDPANPQALVIHLTDLRQRAVAQRVLAQYLRQYRNVPPRLLFREDAFDFHQLAMWRAAIEKLGVADLTLSDIDEAANHVRIGVRSAGAKRALEGRLRQLGIPVSAITVEEVAPTVVQATLQDRIRPVAGGMQIAAAGTCTLTGLMQEDYSGTVSTSSPVYAMTNSHCTDAFGAVTGIAIGQPTQADRIGAEVYDPPLFTDATDTACPPSRNCRYTDAALFLVDAGLDVSRFGYSAWTTALNSITFSGYTVYQGIDSYWLDPMGNPVTKVGRTTGRTNGHITGTCVNMPQYEVDPFGNVFDTGRTLLCQYQTDYADAGGDSGSPVEGEGVNQPGQFWFDGIHWGGNGTSGTYSAWKYLRDEFRTVTPGGWYPTPVPQNGL